MSLPRYVDRRSSFSGYLPTGVKWLLIINTAVFILTGLLPASVQDELQLLALVPNTVVHYFTIWQLVTYLFLHQGIWHLVFNMLTLWMFGVPLEQSWGTRRFLKYYFICGIGAGLCDVILSVALGHNTRTVGASGAIYGLLLAFGVCFPDQTVLMGFLFPLKAKYMVMIYAAIELWMSLSVNASVVSNIAHLGGMAVGFVYLKSRIPSMRRIRIPDWRGAYRQWKLQRAKKKFQVYMRKHGGGPWVN